MTHHKTMITVGALAVAAMLVGASDRVGADISRINYLSMNRSTSLPGVVLGPGSYTFEVLNGHTDIVQVRTKDERRVMYTGFTTLVSRPKSLPTGAVLSFGEAPQGEPVPIRVWFPLGSQTGYEFRR